MKKCLFIVCLLLTGICFSQKVKLKKEVIYIEGNEALSFEKKSHNNEYVIYELNTKNEIINVISYINEGYKKILFTESKKSLETTLGYWNSSFIKWLIEQNVLSLEGKLNSDRIDFFIEKYDEKITDRKLYRN